MSHGDRKGKFGLSYPCDYIWTSALMTEAKVDYGDDFYTYDVSFFASGNIYMTDW